VTRNAPELFSQDPFDHSARERGFVMLVVLWVLTSAVLLVASFNAAVRSGAASAVSEIGLVKSDAILDGGLEIAAAHLANSDPKKRWPGDGRAHQFAFSDTEVTISITDPDGLIDLNKSDEKLLRSFFQRHTKSAAKAAQYTDFILRARKAASGETPGDKTTSEFQATSDTGNTDGFSPPAPAFIDVWQLGRSNGIPHDLFNRIAPYLTVYSRDGTINPLAAPEEVLSAVPELNRADIEKLKYADKSATFDIMQKGQEYLTDESGPAYLVTVSAHRPNDNYSISRTYVILPGLDGNAPYRLIAKWPMVTSAAEKVQ
jgi:general secretion pathway protein K